MDRHDGIRRVVIAAEHLLRFRGLDLMLERVDRALEIGTDVFAALRPLEQHSEVVDLPGKAVAKLDVFGQPPLALQRLLGFGLVVPEIGGGDLLFELR
jgi:hypothetical protein